MMRLDSAPTRVVCWRSVPFFGVIYRGDNSSADFVNIMAYLHDDVFGGAPSAAGPYCQKEN